MPGTTTRKRIHTSSRRGRALSLAAVVAAAMGSLATVGASPASAGDYRVIVHTCDTWQAGTDAHVRIRLDGQRGISSWILLDKKFHNDFERGKTDTFDLDIPWVDYVTSVFVKRDSWGAGPGWCLHSIEIEYPEIKKVWWPFADVYYPRHDWMPEEPVRLKFATNPAP